MYKGMRFSTRQLLLIATLVSLVCAVAIKYGVVGAVVFVLLMLTLWLIRTVSTWIVRVPAVVLAGVLAWGLFAHQYIDDLICPVCHLAMIREKFEFFGISFRGRSVTMPSLIYLVSRDLGCECPHKKLRVADDRHNDYWGMYLRIQVTTQGTWAFHEDEEWYRANVFPSVEEIRSKRCDLVEEFSKRVIDKGDIEYWRYFMDEVLKVPEDD